MKQIFNFLNRHSKTEGAKKTFVLGMGSGISQLITILSSLVITLYYGPDEVGQYSIIIIMVALLSLLYTLRIDSLILIAATTKEASDIYHAANKLSAFISIASFLVIVILKYLTPIDVKPIFLLIPFLTYVFTIYNSDRELCLRNGEFKTEAVSNIVRSISLLLLQILFSFVAPVAGSLAIAKGFSDKISSLWISKKLKTGIFPVWDASLEPFKNYKNEYIPLLKTRFLQNLSNNSIFLYWSYFFDLTSLGLFHFAFKVVQLPSILIGDTIYRVFEEHFTSKGLDASHTKRRGFKVIAFVSVCALIIYGLILLLIDFLVANLFPAQWQESAAYIKIIGLTIVPVALSPVLISIFKIQKRSATFTNIEIIESFIKNICVVIVGFNGTPTSAILAYSLVSLVFGVIKVVFALK